MPNITLTSNPNHPRPIQATTPVQATTQRWHLPAPSLNIKKIVAVTFFMFAFLSTSVYAAEQNALAGKVTFPNADLGENITFPLDSVDQETPSASNDNAVDPDAFAVKIMRSFIERDFNNKTPSEGKQLVQEALNAGPKSSKNQAFLYHLLLNYHLELKEYDEALKTVKQARSRANDPQFVAETLFMTATIHLDQKQFSEAETNILLALDTYFKSENKNGIFFNDCLTLYQTILDLNEEYTPEKKEYRLNLVSSQKDEEYPSLYPLVHEIHLDTHRITASEKSYLHYLYEVLKKIGAYTGAFR